MKIGSWTIRKTSDTGASKPKEKYMLGSFLSLGTKKLSDEKSASNKLIEAFFGWVYINSSTLAEEVSKVELKLYQSRFKAGELVLDEIKQHPLLDLLDQPNDATNGSDFFYNSEAHLNLAGNAFALLDEKVGNKPSKIYLLRPDQVKVNPGDIRQGEELIKNYTYRYRNADNKWEEITYEPEDIMPIKVPNPENMLRGKSTVEAIANDIDLDTFAGIGIREWYEKGMIVEFALSTEQRLNNDQVTAFQSQLKSAYGGLKNAWKVPIFSGGVKPIDLQKSAKDMQMLEQMKWLRDKIMTAFNNTPASLGIIEDVNRANAESTLENWKASVIKPKIKRIVDSLNQHVVPLYGDNLILGFEDPAEADNSEDKKMAISLFKGGVIDRNEARNMIGYDEIADNILLTPSFNVNSPDDLPKSIQNVNYKSMFRKSNLYSNFAKYKTSFDEMLPVARKYLENKRKEPKPIILGLDNAKVEKYAAKQLKIVDHAEAIFRGKLEQLILAIVEEGLSNFSKVSKRKGQLIDKDKWIQESVSKLEPTLVEVAIQAGNQANRLVGIDNPYIPKAQKAVDVRKFIRENIELFAASMLDTDIDEMTSIIATGLSEELSIPEIRRAIQDKFALLSKTQAERITRTEVIKTSNLGAQDAFEQSGVVEAKQWFATDDDRTDEVCLEMDGKIVGLDETYFDKGDEFKGIKFDYSDVEYPPLHPNCRCVILPVIEGVGGFERSISELKLKDRIKELESLVDKRTKEYKQVNEQMLSNEQYVKELERMIGISDEPRSEEETG